MKFTILTAVALAAATLAQPAMAQSADPFQGGHFDLESGWGRTGGSRHGSDGFIYGGRLGYDFTFDKVRVGPEVEITGSTQKDCIPITTNGVTIQQCQRTDRDLYAGGRIGYVVAPTVMLYAKAGYTNGRFGLRDGNASDWRGRDRDGYRVGGGVEYEFISRFYASLEYRYSHYDRDANQNQVMGGIGVRF